MVWCLMEPSHYLNQGWLIISEILWYSPAGNVTECPMYLSFDIEIENDQFKTTAASPSDQWVN